MHVDWWIQQVTTKIGAVTCWIQQRVSPKQVVGFGCVFDSGVDQLIRKFIVDDLKQLVHHTVKAAKVGELDARSLANIAHGAARCLRNKWLSMLFAALAGAAE